MSQSVYYTPQEDEIIREYYPTVSHTEIMQMLPGRTSQGIRVRANRLGVHKNKECYEGGMPFTGSVIGHLSEIEKAYLAGIIDGEGCIMLQRRTHRGVNKPIYALYVSIGNTSPSLKQWLDERIPTKTYNHILSSKNPKHREGYNWILAGNRQVMVFLREIMPYLVIKKEQAQLLANGYVHLPEEERFALFQKIRELKKTS